MTMRRRITEIINEKSIGSSGEVMTESLPNDFTVEALAISFQGANTAAAAITDAETLANLTTLEITTRSGSPIKISGTDLSAFMRNHYKTPMYTSNLDNATDNYINYTTFIYPLNPTGLWNGQMGINPTELGKVRITLGTDAAASADARVVTVTALGVEGAAPLGYMGMFQDSFTAVVGDNFRDIQQEKVIGMMGVFAFGTTGMEDLTTTDAIGIKKIGYAISQSIKEKVRNSVVFQMMQFTGSNNVTGVAEGDVETDYVLLDLGYKEAQYIPYVDKLQVYIQGGVAEAMRVYPMLFVRN